MTKINIMPTASEKYRAQFQYDKVRQSEFGARIDKLVIGRENNNHLRTCTYFSNTWPKIPWKHDFI